MMSTIASHSPGIPVALAPETEVPHPVSDMIDATETLYRLTADEYEQIAGLLDDDRVELIDGYLVKKMTKNPPHVIGCARALAAILAVRRRQDGTAGPESRSALGGVRSRSPTCPWREAPSTIIRMATPGQPMLPWSSRSRIRRWRKTVDGERTYGPAGIPVYWIVNLSGRRVEVYTGPCPDGYATRTDYLPGMHVPLVIDGTIVGQIAVDDLLP